MSGDLSAGLAAAGTAQVAAAAEAAAATEAAAQPATLSTDGAHHARREAARTNWRRTGGPTARQQSGSLFICIHTQEVEEGADQAPTTEEELAKLRREAIINFIEHK